MTIPGMELSETDGHIFLTITPTAAPSPTDEASVIQWLQAQGYGTCQLDQDAIAQAVQSHRTADAQMVFEIGQRLDALISVEVASDAMSATLHITPAQGGTAARPEQCCRPWRRHVYAKGLICRPSPWPWHSPTRWSLPGASHQNMGKMPSLKRW